MSKTDSKKIQALKDALNLNPDIIVEEELRLGDDIHTIGNCAYIEIAEGFIKLDRDKEKVSKIKLTLV